MSGPWQFLGWLAPALYLAGALAGAAAAATWRWRIAAATTRCALAAAGLRLVMAPGDATPALVATLVAFLGWIIGDYSRRYLHGEPGQARFIAAFLVTLAGVSAVVASQDLALLIGAWAASSAGLHHLLTFYRDRPAAMLVAHKKFLASRLAEACLVVAALLLDRTWGTLDLAAIAAHAASTTPLPPPAAAAAALVAIAVLLKCAQLPLHGWLIQVMEAPTPVSALLHAGIVNLGGYVLIRLAPLISAAPAAQGLLVVVGSLTAALAGLVMLTRVTIKVRLAWSTCSQMGLMVAECGLGLYDLALLHLLAHALYKAHAFLTAGEAVSAAIQREIVAAGRGPATRRPLVTALSSLAVSGLVTAASAALWHRAAGLPTLPWTSATMLACGLACLSGAALGAGRHAVGSLGLVIAGVNLYLGWHWLLGNLTGIATPSVSAGLQAWAIATFLALFFAQSWATSQCPRAATNRLYDWVYAGFYLDERFTRLTFRLWPLRRSPG